MVARIWSKEQDAIFAWFEEATRSAVNVVAHLIVRARAGCGKTTTIIEGVNRSKALRIMVCAFSKAIAQELTARLTNPNAQAKTLHGIGFGIVLRYWKGIKVGKGSERRDALTARVCEPRCPDAVRKLVTELHSKGREIAPHARRVGDLTSLIDTFDLAPDDEWQREGWTADYVERKALEAMELAATEKPLVTGIDFADMIFLPVRNRWTSKMYDLVVVDEAQDMTTAQLEIAMGICRGRICVVGDNRQAIFAFRGADSGSLDRLKAELNAEELGLMTTYRCGRAIVAAAAEIVPDFVAGPENPEGEISQLGAEKLLGEVALGDFVLSRTNAPLVSTAMQFLRAGKRTRIAGKDVGAGLRAIVRKLATGRATNSVPALIEKIGTWCAKQTDRMARAGRTDRVDMIQDQAAMLVNLADGAESVQAMHDRIDALFTDDGLGQAGVITCSSVHRAKGLEAERVFVLADTLRSHSEEEMNIQYVAITRAKRSLVFVSPDQDRRVA